MSMSKQHYELIARVLRDAEVDVDGRTSHAALVHRFAVALHDESGFTPNGTRRFKRDVFVQASKPCDVRCTVCAGNGCPTCGMTGLRPLPMSSR